MGCSGSKPAEEKQVSIDVNEIKAQVPAADTANAEAAPDADKPAAKKKKRNAVRADTDDAEDYVMPVTVKTDEERASIMVGIEKSSLLSGCSAEQIESLVNGFSKVPWAAGKNVITEGEDGDNFYMVDSGKYDVYIKALGAKPCTSYAVGDAFGELALLYNSARAATVKCDEAGELWALERKAFRQVMVKSGEENMKNGAEFLKTVSILAQLTDEQRASLAGHLEECSYDDKQYIVTSGEAADAMYIVKAGDVVCTVQEENGAFKELMTLKAGQFFGESAFEDSQEGAKRKANVVAVGKVKALRLTRAALLEHLGDLGDVVAANFKKRVLEGIEIGGVKIFAAMSVDHQDKLLNELTEKVVQRDQTIIQQGGTNDTFYVIKSGECKVLQKQDGGDTRELATLRPGQYFGERALVKDEPASATIMASSPISLYCCARPTFNAYFGSLQDLMDTEIARREKQALKLANAPKWGDLRIGRILGVGTFGRVRLTLHVPTDSSYALKCMRKAQVIKTNQTTQLLYEKRILAMMDHPFILQLMATYQDGGELYMLLEIALGGELFSLLSKRAPLPDSHARFYAAQVVGIFSYMHSLKVLYRDLKPENLLLDLEGYLKMVDYGFAKVLHDRTYTFCGTPDYLAPEVILNKGHGYGFDWWTVGVLTFECLTGGTPFVSDDPMAGYRKIIKCKVDWPSYFRPDAKDFINKLLCVKETKRLGCLKGGSLDVRKHKWFNGHIDFKKLEAKEMSAPYVPEIKGNMDDSNFTEEYEDEGVINFPGDDFPRETFQEFADVWV